jgi:hypothetical protein
MATSYHMVPRVRWTLCTMDVHVKLDQQMEQKYSNETEPFSSCLILFQVLYFLNNMSETFSESTLKLSSRPWSRVLDGPRLPRMLKLMAHTSRSCLYLRTDKRRGWRNQTRIEAYRIVHIMFNVDARFEVRYFRVARRVSTCLLSAPTFRVPSLLASRLVVVHQTPCRKETLASHPHLGHRSSPEH